MGRAKREVPTGKLQLKYTKGKFDKSKAYTLNYYYSLIPMAMAARVLYLEAMEMIMLVSIIVLTNS